MLCMPHCALFTFVPTVSTPSSSLGVRRSSTDRRSVSTPLFSISSSFVRHLFHVLSHYLFTGTHPVVVSAVTLAVQRSCTDRGAAAKHCANRRSEGYFVVSLPSSSPALIHMYTLSEEGVLPSLSASYAIADTSVALLFSAV